MAQFLSLVTSLTLLKPGVLASADVGVLERVEATRVEYGYGLEHRASPGVALVAVEDCNLLGFRGQAIVEGVGIISVYVVDCEQAQHRGQLRKCGLVADVNESRLNHKRATLLLWREK